MQKQHKRTILSRLLTLCLVMCLLSTTGLQIFAEAAFAADVPGDSFTIEQIPGKTQKDVLVNGEHRVIYCMQYDYLWPVTGEGYANPPTNYTEAATIDLLNSEQQATIQRVLYGGYPYDSVGVLAPLYESFDDEASASEAASNLTQAIIWSLLTEWKVPGNTHYTPVMESSGTDIPGWDDAYNGLMNYALHGAPLPHIPSSFTPDVIGNTTFTKQNEYWKTGALSITNPDGFRIMYNVTVPDGIVILDEDGSEIAPNRDFVDGKWVNLGYTVYGGATFYLQTDHGPSAEGQSISITGSAKVPTDIAQYLTNDTGLGDKDDGQGYIRRNFQTMLSVGIDSADFSGGAVLHSAAETVTISGQKIWIHGDNPENQRPTSITVHLHANGEIKQTLTVEPDATGNWTYSFPDMPKFDQDGTEIVYTVDEGYVQDYSASYQGYNITNTYTPGITSINVKKTWNDAANHDGLRPNSVTVKLFADGIDTGKDITLTDNNNWSGEFEDLVEKKDGKRIIYTVEEVPVSGYTSSCEPVNDEGKTVGFIITNTHTPVTRGSLVVSKTVDGNAGSKDKEFTFTVTLKDTSINGTYGDMAFVNGVATFTLKDGESKTATGLPNGIGYTVAEADYSPDGYVTTKSGDEGTIVGDDTLTAAFTNTRNVTPPSDDPRSPQTGDNSNLALWLLLLVLSSFGLVGSGITFRRKNRR